MIVGWKMPVDATVVGEISPDALPAGVKVEVAVAPVWSAKVFEVDVQVSPADGIAAIPPEIAGSSRWAGYAAV